MTRANLRALEHPSPPILPCDDCQSEGKDAGTVACSHCEGAGVVAVNLGGRLPREFPCEAPGCVKGRVKCIVCGGARMYPDPSAVLRCPEDGTLILEDSCCERWPRCTYKPSDIEVELHVEPALRLVS